MDCLIIKNKVKTTLSSFGILVTDFEDTSPTVNIFQREVRNRNGYIHAGLNFEKKDINVSGLFYAKSNWDLEEKKDDINGLVASDTPFFINKMLPKDDIYNFELPGEERNFDLLKARHEPYKYSYKVILADEIDYSFLGKSEKGLLVKISMKFQTAELPFGMSDPVNEAVKTSISYKGTAKCSQLEHPFILKLTASEDQSGTISLTIGNKRQSYRALTPMKKGDVLLFKGVETTLNSQNVNDKTNFEHFILEPNSTGNISVSTNFKGDIEIQNKVEFYK